MLNTSGQAVAGWQYNAFGEQVAAVGSLKDKFHWNADLAAVTCLLSSRCGKLWHRLGVASPCEGEDGYDSRHGRFINRDPIADRVGINLYAFLANNPLGGYEYLGMGFLSKLWKGIKGFVKGALKSIWRQFLRQVVRIVAVAVFGPVVGPWLAVAYGAYSGYKNGGALGAIQGAYGGKRGWVGLQNMNNADRIVGFAGLVGEFEQARKQGEAQQAADRRVRGWGGREIPKESLIFYNRSKQGAMTRAFEDHRDKMSKIEWESVFLDGVREAREANKARSNKKLLKALRKEAAGVTTIDEAKTLLQKYADLGVTQAGESLALLNKAKSVTFDSSMVPSRANGVANVYTDIDGNVDLAMTSVYLKEGLSGHDLLSTLVHEGRHLGQVHSIGNSEYFRELDAHSFEEGFRIGTGFKTGGPNFRKGGRVNRSGIGDWLLEEGYSPF